MDEFDLEMERQGILSTPKDEFDLEMEKQGIVSNQSQEPVKDEFDLEMEKQGILPKQQTILGRTAELMKEAPAYKIFKGITETGGKAISTFTPEPVKEALGKAMMPKFGIGVPKAPEDTEMSKELGKLTFDTLALFAGDPFTYMGLPIVSKLVKKFGDVRKVQKVAKAMVETQQAATAIPKAAVTEDEVVNQILKHKTNKLTLVNLQRKGFQRVTEQADQAFSGKVKEYTYQPVVDAIENRLKDSVETKQKIKNIADDTIKKLKDSKLDIKNLSTKVRQFGEGIYTPANEQEASILSKAELGFRELYDDLFKRQNLVLEPLGRKINYRKDYFRHSMEMKKLEEEFGSLDKVPEKVFNELNSKPEVYLRGQDKTRLEHMAEEELMGAFEAAESYTDVATKTIHYSPVMSRLRGLALKVNEKSPNNPYSHVFEKVADSLADIQTETEKHVATKTWDWLTNRMIKNAITFKISSGLNQLSSYPQMASLSGKPIKSLIEVGKQAARTVGNIPKNIYDFTTRNINKAHSSEVLKLVNNPTFKGAADLLPSQQLNIMLLSDLNKEKLILEGAGKAGSKISEVADEIGSSMMQTTNNLMLRAAYNTGVSQYLKKAGKTLKDAIEDKAVGEAARKAGDFMVSHSQGEYIKHLKPLILKHAVGKNIMPLGTYVFNNFNSITHDLPMLFREAKKAGKSAEWVAAKYVGTLIGTTIATNYAYKKAGVREPIGASDYTPGPPASRFASSSPIGMLQAPKEIYQQASEGQTSTSAVALEKFAKDILFKYAMPGGGAQLESLLMRKELTAPYRKAGQKPKKTKVKKMFEKGSQKVVKTIVKAKRGLEKTIDTAEDKLNLFK